MYRSHNCGELKASNKGKSVVLSGWVNRRRDHGGLIFIDLRDQEGMTQLTFDPKKQEKVFSVAETLRPEFVIRVEGTVALRPAEMTNKKLSTGEIEIEVKKLDILNKAKTPPFNIALADGEEAEDQAKKLGEDVRMKYRYLDMRRQMVREKLNLRSEIIKYMREFMWKEKFQEIETPILTKSTPEGARDYLVPSRVYPGKFYALPQSPQQYKQMLMVAGVDKYFQIAPCFRDEDPRADRSPDQFYQLDIEMAFPEQDKILDLCEKLFTAVAEKFTKKKILQTPWPRLTHAEVMEKYGVDKPDLRFNLEIKNVTEIVKNCGFKVFSNVVKDGGVVKAIKADSAAKFSRQQIDDLTEYAKAFGAKGLAYIVVEEKGLKSPIVKFLRDDVASNIVKEMGAKVGDTIFFGAGDAMNVRDILGQVRNKLGEMLELADPNVLAFCFVIDWPLFEEEKNDGHYAPAHHMFTAPKEEDLDKLEKEPNSVKSYQHDMVLNGVEVGGGSIRIHDRETQDKIFKLIGFSEKDRKYFEHMLEAFEYGAPPHGGIAPGIDRFIMTLLNEENIREVIPFPKTGSVEELMMGSPSEVSEDQLKDLSLEVKKRKDK
ncbi:MAG: aspartate--tRNA ligase [bacterium]